LTVYLEGVLHRRNLIRGKWNNVAHAVYACSPSHQLSNVNIDSIDRISHHLQPENIDYPKPYVCVSDGLLAAVINPVASLTVDGINVCIGGFFGAAKRWQHIGATPPDGTYALFKGDARHIELHTDAVSSRTIWYVFDEGRFIASTSQRAIICLLQDFALSPHSSAWMIANGLLSWPGGWDRRIRRMPADARLLLNRESWEMTISRQQIHFSKSDLSDEVLTSRLADAIDCTLSSIDIDSDRWLLPLSGGYDSRALLQGLSKHKRLQTVTWGTEESLSNKRSDAWIAQLLSEEYSTDHEYYALDLDALNARTILDRFLKNGEGRTDHLSGYMDGFRLWETFFHNGIHGVIRGDEALGSSRRRTTWELYCDYNYNLLSDYSNLDNIVRLLALPEQQREPSLLKKTDEPLSDYIERFHVEHYCSCILAALNDLKAMYCEIVNPLLSKRILSVSRQLPDHMRIGKRLFKQMVIGRTPGIAMAQDAAIARKADLLRTPKISNYILEYLRNYKGDALRKEAIHLIVERAQQDLKKVTNGSVQEFSDRIGRKLRRTLRLQTRLSMNLVLLAFRAFIICRMNEILTEDAELLKDCRLTESTFKENE